MFETKALSTEYLNQYNFYDLQKAHNPLYVIIIIIIIIRLQTVSIYSPLYVIIKNIYYFTIYALSIGYS